MPKPRHTQISLDTTPYYHCTSRCVRRAFLCGLDSVTHKDYEHRRQWLEGKLLETADIFALDICAYAIMSNHYHVVLHINKAQAAAWSFDDVIHKWHQLFSGHSLSKRYLQNDTLCKAERDALDDIVKKWRQRLMDISWFMRIINENIARQANAEDDCTGRFWEGRYKSQALLDEPALAACMAYVDLNPMRAKIADAPATSDHTSIKQRIQSILNPNHPDYKKQAACLFPFAGNPRDNMPEGLPFNLTDYIALVEMTGRQLRENKKGKIRTAQSPILSRLQFETESWFYLSRNFESKLKTIVGSVINLKIACKKLGYIRTIGKQSCEALFP